MLQPAACLAYIDPGTMQNMFGILGPVLAGLAAVVGFLLWPFRFVFYRFRDRYRTFSRAGQVTVWAAIVVLLAGGGAGVYSLITEEEDSVTGIAKGTAKFERMIVLGMDGLDPNIVEEMMGRGELPNFSKLAETGSYSRLATSNPPESPVAWSSIATGAGPGEHGIFDFLHREPKGKPDGYVPYLSLRKQVSGLTGTRYEKARQRDGFWAFTSAAKIPTTVVRWPVAFPAEQVTGNFLSGFGVPDLEGGEGHYVYYTSTPIAEDDAGKQNVTSVTWDQKSLTTELQGPRTGKASRAVLPLTVTRNGDDRATIAIDGANPASVEAEIGHWSRWMRVAFPIGLGRKVYGQVKFMLMELEPHLKLVCSPIHMDGKKQAFPFTSPVKYAEELEERIGEPYHTLGMPEQVHALSHERYGYDEFLAECDAVHAERRKMLTFELERFKQGVFAFVFDTSDRLQHAFWATRDPDHPAYKPELAEQYGHVIPDMYREMDSVLGEVLGHVDSKTALVVLSDHGFNSFRRSVHVNRWLIENGYQNLTIGNDKPGQDLFRDIDWSKTKAYAVGFASLYLNVQGREMNGIVDPSSQYRQLCEEIAAKMREWKDPKTGEPLLKDVYIAADTYTGPQTSKGPDLILGLKPGYRASWQTALGGAPLEFVEDNDKRWSGDHLIDPTFVPGIFFSNQKINNPQPSLVDICPTVLSSFGIAAPDYVAGKPLF